MAPSGSFTEDRHLGMKVDAGLEIGLLASDRVNAFVSGPDPDHPLVFIEHLWAGKAGKHVDACLFTNTSIEDTTTHLVVPVRPADRSAAYPLSGTRVHTAVTKGPGDRGMLTVRRQETFDGTNIVKVELTVNGVTQSCTFDLATKTSTCKRD